MARILVVDDDQSNAEVLHLVLTSQQHQVRSITTSSAIDSAIARFRPQLIVMDILLDHGDGRVFCNMLKRRKETENIPILLLTAMLESQVLAVEHSADCLMFKPFDYDNLGTKVNQLLERSGKAAGFIARNGNQLH